MGTLLLACGLWSLPPRGANITPSLTAPALDEEEIDAALQRAATTALGGREGAALVLDARTGRLRAVVNSRLAFEEATTPGSTIKVFTELTALRDSLLNEETRALCRGQYEGAGLKLNCSHPPRQPPFNPVQALAYSCNTFFGKLGERLDGERHKRTLSSFGFGARTGAGEREAPGALPRGEVGVAVALGESRELLVTPVQLITAYAALVNGGHLLTPWQAVAGAGAARQRARIEIAPAHRALLLAGMRGATTYGTAARAGLDTLPVHVFGKTGTSTPLDDFRPQGWFVGFAADEKPQGNAPPTLESIGLAVLVLLKRAHGSDSAVAARPIFEAYARLLERRRAASEISSGRQAPGGALVNDEAAVESAPDATGPQVRVRLAREDATLRLPLDEYVFGVIAAEGSVEDEPEALKALAVTVRSYALRNLRRHARDGYDLCNSTHCQRYVLVRDESRRPEFYELARRAVAQTAGEVVRDGQERVAESYFSASCGGATADIGSLWGVTSPPAHLRGARDEFCAGMPHREWTDVIPRERLLRAARSDARSDVGARLDAVSVLKRDRSGRAETVLVEGERRRVLRGWDFKIIVGRELGWKTLKSSRFEVARAGDNFIFRGAGFGHGLGLCQSGAHVMARRGASYRQILARYLPGTNVGPATRVTEPKESSANGAHSSASTARNEMVADSRVGGAGGLLSPDTGLNEDHAKFQISSFKFQIWNALNTPVLSASLLSVAARFAARDWSRDGVPFGALNSREHATALVSAAFASVTRRAMSSEHFRVSYPAGAARRDVEAALGALEAARAEVLRRLDAASVSGSMLTTTTELFVHETTGDFTSATGEPASVAATTRGRRIESQPLETLRRRRALETTLRHEYVHVAAEALSRGRAPRWLVEGLAIHVAGEGRRFAGAATKRRPSVEEIERGLEHPASAQQMRELYAAAYAKVSDLIRREGEAAVWRRVARG